MPLLIKNHISPFGSYIPTFLFYFIVSTFIYFLKKKEIILFAKILRIKDEYSKLL